MTWTTVEAALIFRQSSDNWGEPIGQTITAVSSAQETEFRTLLQSLYNGSSTAASILDQVVSSMGHIKIGIAGNGEPAFFGANSGYTNGYIAIDFSLVDDTYYFNDVGFLVQDRRDLALIHEIAHLTNKSDPEYDISSMNFDPDYDFDGRRYYFSDGDLNIYAPDGSGIIIAAFTNGDFGINVGAAITGSEVTFEYEEVSPDVWEWTYDSTLGPSSIADNAQDYDYASLPGYASTLSSDGTNSLPTSWLP